MTLERLVQICSRYVRCRQLHPQRFTTADTLGHCIRMINSISLKEQPIFSIRTLLQLAALPFFSKVPIIRIYAISRLHAKSKLGSYRYRNPYMYNELQDVLGSTPDVTLGLIIISIKIPFLTHNRSINIVLLCKIAST